MLRNLAGLDHLRKEDLSGKDTFHKGTLCDLPCTRRMCSEKEPRDHPRWAELAYAREWQPWNPPWKPR